jgi:hypothetical protein
VLVNPIRIQLPHFQTHHCLAQSTLGMGIIFFGNVANDGLAPKRASVVFEAIVAIGDVREKASV